MFQLHYVIDGALESPVESDREFIMHSRTARATAVSAAAKTLTPVQVSRMRAGKLVGAYIIEPDGAVKRPLGTKAVSEREDCKAPAACFCSPCRAARRR